MGAWAGAATALPAGSRAERRHPHPVLVPSPDLARCPPAATQTPLPMGTRAGQGAGLLDSAVGRPPPALAPPAPLCPARCLVCVCASARMRGWGICEPCTWGFCACCLRVAARAPWARACLHTPAACVCLGAPVCKPGARVCTCVVQVGARTHAVGDAAAWQWGHSRAWLRVPVPGSTW